MSSSFSTSNCSPDDYEHDADNSTHVSRLISSLSLAPSLIAALQSGGFVNTQDIIECTARDLSKELNVSIDDAVTIISSAKSAGQPYKSGCNGIDLVKSLPSSGLMSNSSQSNGSAMTSPMNVPIITFCKTIDLMLGGGIHSGQITEICGVPGIGKTQMAMQLALDVQIPQVFRGCDGEAVYIDTEGSCLPERLSTMAESLVKHLRQIASNTMLRLSQISQESNFSEMSQDEAANLQMKQDLAHRKQVESDKITVASLLNGIHIFRAHDQTEMLAVISQLNSFLKSHPKVKLVIIDSIAFPFRADMSALAVRLLNTLSQDLYRIAIQHTLAVVTVNHVSTKVNRGGGSELQGSSAQIIPALGEFWSHAITNRLMMYWQESSSRSTRDRVACLVKSPSRPRSRASFTVLQAGVRDVSLHSTDTQQETADSQEQPSTHHQYNADSEQVSSYNLGPRVFSRISSSDESTVHAKRSRMEFIPNS